MRLRGRFNWRKFALSISAAVLFLLLLVVSIGAVRDIVSTADAEDLTARRAVLGAELTSFLLATRTEDGTFLLDNPSQHAAAGRKLTIGSVQKPFFEYLIRTANAKYVQAQDLQWSAPQACDTEFPVQSGSPAGAAFGLRACFATLANDPAGRYVYFGLKFPSPPITRHRRGTPAASSDYVRLRFNGQRQLVALLVFETPALAEKRYPSQVRRFDGLHEVTAYSTDGALIRRINAQAFEGQLPGGVAEGINHVTIVGRIDAVELLADGSTSWPAPLLANSTVGVDVARREGDKVSIQFSASADAVGKAVASVEQAYRESIKSGSHLEITRNGRQIWESSQLEAKEQPGRFNDFQKLSDWWTDHVISAISGQSVRRIKVDLPFAQGSPIVASLASNPFPMPAIVARAFLWLSLGVLLTGILAFVCLAAISRIWQISKIAAKIAYRPLHTTELKAFSRRRDETGALARIIDVLVRRSSSRDRRLSYKLRAEEARIKSRQAVLEAIGHEIRSPLQTLLKLEHADPAVDNLLERMDRAVEALYTATSIEAGIQSGRIVNEELDIAEYLSVYCENVTNEEMSVAFSSASKAVLASFDPINFEQVLEHILDNARRLRTPGSAVQVSLTESATWVTVEIANEGSHIDGDPELIFNYGVTGGFGADNKGQGLFVARMYLSKMNGSIKAENRGTEVVISIDLPKATPRVER